ncbi:major capsid protein [Aureimonas sp. AU40]|uniref:major capsid protein n=1 Tax=Aureimonas sp. AU40 TaxID=1637747 RepID=UPI000785592D|nr:phage major capsid protein [Aureimonas sp. AU40]
MPLLVEEAEKLSEIDLVRGVIEEIIHKDELFALLPWVRTEGKSYDYVRELTISEGEFLSAYEDVPEGAATFDEVSTKCKVLAGQILLDNFTTESMSDLNPQLGIQIRSKAKGLGIKFRRTLVNGDSSQNKKSFDGIKTLTPAGQTLVAGANGGAVSLEALDELKDAVLLGADAFMMREGTWRGLKSILRTFGGNTAPMMMIENFGMVPAIDGMPVIINDFIRADEVQGTNDKTTSIYALRLNEADGFHGLWAGAQAGIRYEHLGTSHVKDADLHRLKWYCGTALKATHALARLKGVTNI